MLATHPILERLGAIIFRVLAFVGAVSAVIAVFWILHRYCYGFNPYSPNDWRALRAGFVSNRIVFASWYDVGFLLSFPAGLYGLRLALKHGQTWLLKVLHAGWARLLQQSMMLNFKRPAPLPSAKTPGAQPPSGPGAWGLSAGIMGPSGAGPLGIAVAGDTRLEQGPLEQGPAGAPDISGALASLAASRSLSDADLNLTAEQLDEIARRQARTLLRGEDGRSPADEYLEEVKRQAKEDVATASAAPEAGDISTDFYKTLFPQLEPDPESEGVVPYDLSPDPDMDPDMDRGDASTSLGDEAPLDWMDEETLTDDEMLDLETEAAEGLAEALALDEDNSGVEGPDDDDLPDEPPWAGS